jgi:GT2 family glycosyltransferase
MTSDESLAVPRADPRVGIVVLSYNRADEVIRTLERLVALPERPAIVVVDNGSTDGTHEMVRHCFPAITCIHLATNRGAAGRNVGVEACDRPYVALCDDDTWWEPGALTRAADLLDAHPKIAVITGKVLVNSTHLDPTCLFMANSPLPAPPGFPGTSLLGFLAGASIVRRDAFLAVGGFEPRLFLGAEEELLMLDLASAGWALAYAGDLVVHHHPSPNRNAESRRRLLVRNKLWIVWLRRPPRAAITRTLVMIRAGMHDRAIREALHEAFGNLRWVVANRRCISASLDRQLRQLERARSEWHPGGM